MFLWMELFQYYFSRPMFQEIQKQKQKIFELKKYNHQT